MPEQVRGESWKRTPNRRFCRSRSTAVVWEGATRRQNRSAMRLAKASHARQRGSAEVDGPPSRLRQLLLQTDKNRSCRCRSSTSDWTQTHHKHFQSRQSYFPPAGGEREKKISSEPPVTSHAQRGCPPPRRAKRRKSAQSAAPRRQSCCSHRFPLHTD